MDEEAHLYLTFCISVVKIDSSDLNSAVMSLAKNNLVIEEDYDSEDEPEFDGKILKNTYEHLV
jgi:hypothetical protein